MTNCENSGQMRLASTQTAFSKRGRSFGRCVKAALIASASLSAVSVAAQDATSDDRARSGLETIVVTAERRESDVQTTPIAVSVVRGDQLAERQIAEIQDLETQVPGLSFTQNGFTSNINLRGLGNTTTSPNITTGVAVFFDGLYQPEAIQLNAPFYDVATVEVLRGPQGTIVGQNSTGGSLQINTRDPEFDTGVSGFVDVTVGNFDHRRLQGAINLPMTDTLAARVAFNLEKRDSFYTNLGPAASLGTDQDSTPGRLEQQNMRIGLLWEPSASFSALFKADLNQIDMGGLTARPRPACATCPPQSSYVQYGYTGPSSLNGNRQPGTYDLVYNTPTSMEDTVNRYSLELNYTLPSGIVFRSLSGYQHLKEVRVDDSDSSAAPIGVFPGGSFTQHLIGPNNDYYSQEVNLISPSSQRLTWLAGASYFHRETPVELVVYPDGAQPSATGADATLILDSISRQELIGVYGQVGFEITPSLQIEAGARYSWDRNEQEGRLLIGIAPGVQIPVPIEGTYSGSDPTGKIALNWEVNDANFVYAFYARGYKQGGINSAVSTFRPEKVDDYEIGWKSKLFGNQALLQVGAYYMKYFALQQSVLNPQTTQTEITNLGDSEIYGLEASVQAQFGGLHLDAGLAYNHSELGAVTAVADFRLPGPANQLGPQCAPGQAAGCFDYQPFTVDLSGQRNPYSPTITANASLGYEFLIGNDASLTPRISVSYIASQYASIFQDTDYFLIPGRTTFDAYLVFNAGDWGAELFARNLGDKAYITGLGGATAFYSAPRTYGLSVSRNF